MRAWALLLGGLIVWTVHFFTLYAIGSVFLTTPLARVLTLVVTAACLLAALLLLASARRGLRRAGADPMTRWMPALAALVAALSFVAVLWQGLPAVLI